MEPLQNAFEPYRHVDPIGWVGVFRFMQPAVGGIAIALGVLMLLYGGRRLFRVVAMPLGALVATIWAVPLAQRLGVGGNFKQLSLVATLGMAGIGLLWPPAVIFFAFGIPSGLMGGQLAGANDWLLGFGPGFLVGGAIGVVLHRPVAAILSAAVGAWVAVLGAMAALHPFVGAVEWLAQNPVAVLTIAAIAALAGSVFQLFVRPSEEEAKKRKIEKALEKKKAQEQKALEERWAKYNQKSE